MLQKWQLGCSRFQAFARISFFGVHIYTLNVCACACFTLAQITYKKYVLRMIYPDIFYPSNRLWFPDQYFLVATFKCFICNILVGISRATKHSFSLYDCIAPHGIHFAGLVVQCCATMDVGIEMLKRGFKHLQEQSDNRHQRYTNGILPPIIEVENGPIVSKRIVLEGPILHFHDFGRKGIYWRASQRFLMISWMNI